MYLATGSALPGFPANRCGFDSGLAGQIEVFFHERQNFALIQATVEQEAQPVPLVHVIDSQHTRQGVLRVDHRGLRLDVDDFHELVGLQAKTRARQVRGETILFPVVRMS